MLRLSHVARFASNSSPLREQREVLFAAQGNDDSKNKIEALVRQADEEILNHSHATADTNVSDTIQRVIQETAQKINGPLATMHLEEAREIAMNELRLTSPNALKIILDDQEVFDEALARQIAQDLQIPIEQQMTTQDISSLIEEYTLGEWTPPETKNLLLAHLSEQPPVVARLARGLLGKLTRYDELFRLLSTPARGPISALEKYGHEFATIVDEYQSLTSETDRDKMRREYVEVLKTQVLRLGQLLKAQVDEEVRENTEILKQATERLTTESGPMPAEVTLGYRLGTLTKHFAIQAERANNIDFTTLAVAAENTSAFIEQALDVIRELENCAEEMAGERAEMETANAFRLAPSTPEAAVSREAFLAPDLAEDRRFNALIEHHGSDAAELRLSIASWPEDAKQFVEAMELPAMLEIIERLYNARQGSTPQERRMVPGAEMLDADTLDQWMTLVHTIQRGGPEGVRTMAEASQQQKKWEGQEVNQTTCETWHTRIEAVETSVLNRVEHAVCRYLEIPRQLRDKCNIVRTSIDEIAGWTVGGPGSPGYDRIPELQASVERELALLEAIDRALTQKVKIVELEKQDYVEKAGESRGMYHRGEKCIYLNKQWLDGAKDGTREKKYQRLVEHEMGHHILNMLQHTAFPSLLSDALDALDEFVDEEGTPLITDQMLLNAGEEWGYPREAYEQDLFRFQQGYDRHTARAKALEPYVEELFLKFESWKRNKNTRNGGSPAERALFTTLLEKDALRRLPISDVTIGGLNFSHASANNQDVRYSTGGDPDDDEEDADDAAAPAAPADALPLTEADDAAGYYNAEEDLKKVKRDIVTISGFRDAYAKDYPNLKTKLDDQLENAGGLREGAEQVESVWRKGYYLEHGHVVQVPNPEKDETYKSEMERLKEHLKEITDFIEKFDADKADVDKAKATGSKGMWGWWTSHVTLLSVLDIMKIGNDFKEDYLDMWHRYQVRHVSEVELGLTKWIPEWIPAAGKFKHYFERRKNQAELDDVQKWQNAYENSDAHTIISKLGGVRNKDQLKGIMNLLAKHGHIEWDNQGLWEALNALSPSGYRIPREPCLRDTRLRDRWLRKIITDIWDDYELYTNWKTQNDSGYDHKKNEFTAEADNASNMSGGLSTELKSMLRKFMAHHHGPPGVPEPPDVSPHRYEEYLTYAMRNGKMSMEQKFYFLIRGIAEGLLPVDRLRVIAGEKGEILLKFPFLDFFYQKNNTLAEIRALADKIMEKPGDHNNLDIGLRTTQLLRFIVLRDPTVRVRVNKATARRGEGIDHEDIPYIFTDVGVSTVEGMMGNSGDDQAKTTFQGMQNAYVGFNEKFKFFARLAELKNKGEANFTREDAKNLAQTIAAYVVFDNQASNFSTFGRRKGLSPSQFDSESPPSNDKIKTRDFRNRTSDFVQNLVIDRLMPNAGFNFDRVFKNSKLRADAKKEDMVKMDRNKYDEKTAEIFHKAAGAFEEELTAAILRDPQQLIDALAAFETQKGFLWSDSEGTTTKAERDTEKMDKFDEEYFALITGGGAGGGHGH